MKHDVDKLGAAAARLLTWLDDEARGLLEAHDPPRVAAARERLQELRERLGPARREISICFLGNAAVGKSTLLNTLVDPEAFVVPAGGVGSLTAQATLVRYSEQPYLRASYHGARHVNQVIFALTTHLKRSSPGSAAQAEGSLEVADRLEMLSAVLDTRPEPGTPGDSGVVALGSERTRAYISQASLMITGRAVGDERPEEVEYLVDALRSALELPPAFGHDVRAEHLVHVERLAEALRHSERTLKLEPKNRPAFFAEIRCHASGSLAPLIKHLEVGWHSKTLPPGVVLVDLPGVGIANDEYRAVTSEWMRRAEAVVLVVDRAGVSEASVEMLRTTGYLNALLHRDPESEQVSPLLWLAMVRLDDVASDDRTVFRQEHPDEPVSPWRHFMEFACARGEKLLGEQMRQLLQRQASSVEEQGAHAALLRSLRCFAVSAVQHRKLLGNDDENPPLIRVAAESRIHTIVEALHELAARYQTSLGREALAVLSETRGSLERGLCAIIDELDATARQREQSRLVRARFEEIAAALRQELAQRLGALREKLRQSLPLLIEREVQASGRASRKRQSAYLDPLQGLHWKTLVAAVRRGGTFLRSQGQATTHIDLPNDMSLRYEAELAPVWNRVVVAEIRRTFADYASDVHRVLGRVLTWASQPELQLEVQAVERYRTDVARELAQLGDIVERRADELRQEIKLKLYQRVEEKIRLQCESFVLRRLDSGEGVYRRTQALLAELPELLEPEVAKLAGDLLLTTYRTSITDLGDQFGKSADPIERAQALLLMERLPSSPDEVAQRQAQLARARELLGELGGTFAAVEA
jgi:hypothetical protein